jgi:hypothetical protein
MKNIVTKLNSLISSKKIQKKVSPKDIISEIKSIIEQNKGRFNCDYMGWGKKEFLLINNESTVIDGLEITISANYTFGINVKRSKKTIQVTKTKSRYLHYISEDPISFLYTTVYVKVPKFNWVNNEEKNLNINISGSTRNSLHSDELLSPLEYVNGNEDKIRSFIKHGMCSVVYNQYFNFMKNKDLNVMSDLVVILNKKDDYHVVPDELYDYVRDNLVMN